MKKEELLFDPSLNILHRHHRQLDAIFMPKSVAVIGATETPRSVGRTVLWNLLQSPFGGTVYPINPKRKSVLGIKAYPSVKDISDSIDLAVIITPAKIVPSLIKECVEKKIPAAIIISAGFKEMGEPGEKLEAEIQNIAKSGNMRIIGPNCLGVMNPIHGLNATFAADMGHKGNIAFLSQSGALCTAVLDWSLRENVGFSSFVSVGSMLDVNWGDLINYFGNDPHTESILIYMESIGDSRSFLSAAREVALTKPIILIKAGKTEESAQAAVSHTGALSGSDDVLNAALRRVGVLRVDSIADLFSMAAILSKQPKPKGPNLTIVTNAGGPGVIATDALIENKGKLTKISKDKIEELNQFLPEAWSHNNPVDVLGDASAEVYAKAVKIALEDPASDGVLVILTPQDMTDPTTCAKELKALSHQDKPVLASWMGAGAVASGITILNKAKIPTFEYPDMAAKAFAYMWKYSYNLQGIYESPTIKKQIHVEGQVVKDILAKVQKDKRHLLSEDESKEVLKAYHIPTVPTEVASTAKEAVELAEKMGYPVVLKLYSHTITHKTDVGGVKLKLANQEMVKSAFKEIHANVKKLKGEKHFQGVTVQPMIQHDGYELILGSSIDPQFGPTILFGVGGQLVEVFRDNSIGLPPLTTTLARRMMEQTKIYQALKGVRGKKAVDLDLLEQTLVQFSLMILENPLIKECDINPLIISHDQMMALDARIVLFDRKTKEKDLPKPAIRPYPQQYVSTCKLKGGEQVELRPIKPEDESLIVGFHKELSERTIKQRYLKSLHYDELVAHRRLVRICFNDYDREIALVVEKKKPRQIIAVGRMSRIEASSAARFAIIVQDPWQNKGIGFALLNKLLEIAAHEKIDHLVAEMLPENKQMIELCKKLGFQLKPNQEKGLILAIYQVSKSS